MKRNHFLATMYLIPTLIFGMCTTEEKQEMKDSGYSSSQVSDVCSENNNFTDEGDSSTAKHSYVSVEAAYVGQSGPGFFMNMKVAMTLSQRVNPYQVVVFPLELDIHLIELGILS